MILSENYIIYVDKVDTNTSYIGRAVRESDVSKAVWQIKKVLKVGTVTRVTYAQGSDRFDYVWNSRASYTYK